MAPTVTRFPISGDENLAASWQTMLNNVSGNFIVSGLTPTAGAGLTLNIAAGVAHIAGVRHNIGANTATMADASTNYVFYDADTQTWHVDTDNSRPTNSVAIAKVVTAGGVISTITDYRFYRGDLVVDTNYQNKTGIIALLYVKGKVRVHAGSNPPNRAFVVLSDSASPPTTEVYNPSCAGSFTSAGDYFALSTAVTIPILPDHYFRITETNAGDAEIIRFYGQC